MLAAMLTFLIVSLIIVGIGWLVKVFIHEGGGFVMLVGGFFSATSAALILCFFIYNLLVSWGMSG